MNRITRKVYQKPQMDIQLLAKTDVIVTSGGVFAMMEYGVETQMDKFGKYSADTASDWVDMKDALASDSAE